VGEVSPRSITTFRPWTSRELEDLRRLAHLGAEECARRLGRSTASVRRAAQRHRISLRPPGERGGRLLGQPRGLRLARAQREALLAARRHDRLVAAHLALARGGGALCPACGRRPVSTGHGLCLACHERALADAAAEAAVAAEELRRRWREHQRRSRALRDLREAG
jgi:hypothetical protein